jgi:hypothetical protein
MVIRAVVVLISLLALPAAGIAQDAPAVLQELQKALGKELPRGVRINVAGSGYKAGADGARTHYRIEPHTQQLDAAAPDALWRSPLAFVAAAAAGKAALAAETLFGTPYQVIILPGPNGQPVRGYVTDKHVLERIRTERQGGGTKVRLETVFMDWREFNGVRFPGLIIEKENDQVSRILVVSEVQPAPQQS